MLNYIFKIIIITILLTPLSRSEEIEKIYISGNERISDETILLFAEISLDKNYDKDELNDVLIKLYETNFFEDITLNVNNRTLFIELIENPIIQSVEIKGISANKLKEPLYDLLILKDKSSFIKSNVKKDEITISNFLRSRGYYFANIESSYTDIGNNLINLVYKIELGGKAKIKSIKFLGNNFYKDGKLRNIILSEEYKFWKFVSGKKFLNKELINLDQKLLQNFYKNNGFYLAEILPTFAKYKSNDNFELIYNIKEGEKFFFNKIKLVIPDDYDESDFVKINKIFQKIKDQPYSFEKIEEILDQIDLLAAKSQYQFIDASVEDKIIDKNKIDLVFNIKSSEKVYIEKINLIGNNITRENVIRDQLIVDEGDAFNKILHNKSINNLKGLRFFKSVNSEVLEGSNPDQKIINLILEEKATGEISAGAGVGTEGGTVGFSVSENNYLGKGIGLKAAFNVSAETVRGQFSVNNPNFVGTDRSANFSAESTETDRLKNFGYKSTKTGFSIGTNFEYYEDFYLLLGLSTYYENLETDNTASVNLKKQKGKYFDTNLKYTLDYDKRNQKFETSDGFRSRFTQILPIINKKNTIENIYEFKFYKELLQDTVTKWSFYANSVNSISGDDVKLSDRSFLPSSKLRGFEPGKVGPIDGSDYVGGNYSLSATMSNSLTPYILPNTQNLDFSIFYDVGNVWGVDYDENIDNSNKIRSSLGLTIDWFTPIGPLNFSISEVLTSVKTDKKEFFRFNLGTTF